MVTRRRSNAQKPKFDDRSADFLLTQYSALRNEIIKRMELQNQIISLMLIASGALISFGFQADLPIPILTTPLLVFFLASFWANHDVRIRHFGRYIRKYIEEAFLEADKGWEGVGGTGGTKYLARRLSLITSPGIFVSVQIFSMGAVLVLQKNGIPLGFWEQVYLIVDALLIPSTVYMMTRPKEGVVV